MGTPEYVPAFTGFSFIIKGCASPGRAEEKVKLLKREVMARRPDIVLLQETHWETMAQAVHFLNRFAGEFRGLSLTDTTGSKGVVAMIPKWSSLAGLVTDVEVEEDGRWAVMERLWLWDLNQRMRTKLLSRTLGE